MTYVGADACSGGWFAVIADGDGLQFDQYDHIEDLWDDHIEDLWDDHEDASRILVDIPIGLPKTTRRQCDELAKEYLGCRGLSVFYTPCRAVLDVPDENYDEANELNEKTQGHGLSQQAWNIVPKIREVDDLFESSESARDVIRESHPELCFYAFNDENPIAYSKQSDRGLEKRRNVLRSVLDGVDELYEDVRDEYYLKEVARDDIHDALVLVAAARHDELLALPEEPPEDSRERPMAITYPHP